MSVSWNPWHGCFKISPGCENCYVYRRDSLYEIDSRIISKTSNFDLPVKKNRKKEYKIPSGETVSTCFTSDFLLKEADNWREECWKMISERQDLRFFFITKRIDRFMDIIPPDWNDNFNHVAVGCTVENQKMADYRLPYFCNTPIKNKIIIIAPMLEKINIEKYLSNDISEVSVGGESGINARPCNYDWVLDIRNQCVKKGVPFTYHQTGAKLIKDGKMYRIKRKHQHSQAHKAGIDT
ncbi:MAG: DUF5131 family protein [Clostridia bacterium]|nr:DUF5131 family protein [Clostridia bacterium]